MNILSVDWDYFFPDIDGYDWGHHEESALLYETIWSLRAGNRDMSGKNRAVDHIRPDKSKLDGFWNRIQTVKMPPMFMAVCESHKSLYEWIEANRGCIKNVEITNFDAHHDFGYGHKTELNCGNWAYHAMKKKLIKKYHLVYPEWRKEHPEAMTNKPTSVHYGSISPVEYYAGIFICRSSCWTPTWADDEWVKFIEHWKKEDKEMWDRKTYSSYVLNKRSPNLVTAIKLADEHEKQLAEFRKKVG